MQQRYGEKWSGKENYMTIQSLLLQYPKVFSFFTSVKVLQHKQTNRLQQRYISSSTILQGKMFLSEESGGDKIAVSDFKNRILFFNREVHLSRNPIHNVIRYF